MVTVPLHCGCAAYAGESAGVRARLRRCERNTASALSLIDRIALLEQSALGEQSQGGAVPRVAALEEALLGAVSAGRLPDRVKALEVAMGM